MFVGTWWSLMPPIIAILLALLTKEVYLSLFAGCALGALLGVSANIVPEYNRCEIEEGDILLLCTDLS